MRSSSVAARGWRAGFWIDDFAELRHALVMTIQLTKDQIATLQKRVDSGRYTSVESALDCVIASTEFEDDFDDEFEDWARPLIAEAIAEADRGAVPGWRGEGVFTFFI